MQSFLDHLVANQAAWRGGVFISALLALSLLEGLKPRRVIPRRKQRWVHHLFLGTANLLLLRLVLPGGLMAIAMIGQGGGLIGWLGLQGIWAILVSLLVLDFVVYAQHMGFHKISFLWPLHAPHHGDRALDVTSGLRFHPGEALVSAAIKGAAIFALGAPLASVIAFEIILTAASLFTHANWAMGRADTWLRWVIITPDIHRLHHSRLETEAQHNFGFFLSIWDRAFGNWKDSGQKSQTDMQLGLDDMPEDGLVATLTRPWQSWLPSQK